MLYPYGGIGLFRNFLGIEGSITFVSNYGAIWGVLSSYPTLLVAIRIILISVMLFTLVLYTPSKPYLRMAMALLLGGAISNVLDSFIYGYVVDMIHIIFWGFDYPVFNIADSCICIGIFILIIDSLFYSDKHEYSSS